MIKKNITQFFLYIYAVLRYSKDRKDKQGPLDVTRKNCEATKFTTSGSSSFFSPFSIRSFVAIYPLLEYIFNYLSVRIYITYTLFLYLK